MLQGGHDGREGFGAKRSLDGESGGWGGKEELRAQRGKGSREVELRRES